MKCFGAGKKWSDRLVIEVSEYLSHRCKLPHANSRPHDGKSIESPDSASAKTGGG